MKVLWYGQNAIVLAKLSEASFAIQTDDGEVHEVYESEFVEVKDGYDVTTGEVSSHLFEV